jgi:hypothetical protein
MITREVVNGKPATVAFLNDRWEPVAPEHATMVEVTFDDGRVMFGTKEAK